jgi:hypothetical protein
MREMQAMQRRIVCLVFVALFLAVAPLALAFDAADLNQNGEVDATDAGIFFQAWRHYRAQIPLTGVELNADVYPVGSPDGVIDRNDFRVFVEAFVQSYAPKINPADFLVFNDGDKRYFVDGGGIYLWRDQVDALAGRFQERRLRVIPTDETREEWLVQSGHVIAYGMTTGGGGGGGGGAYTYATPMQLPDKLAQGVPVVGESDVLSGLTPVGHITLTLTLLEVEQTVVGAGHTWGGCCEVRVRREGTINGQPCLDDRIVWLAPGMGPVKEDTNPASPWTSMATLQYIKVGSTIYGTIPSAAPTGLYPMAAGNMFILQFADFTVGQKILAPKTVGGHSCGVQAEFGLPDGDSAQYFSLSSGSVSGFAGFKLSHDDPYHYALSPAVSFGTTLTMGNTIVGSGAVQQYDEKNNTSTSYGTYVAYICPVGFEQTVTVGTTALQHCVVLDFYMSATRTGESDPFWEVETRTWFAPGAGPVKVMMLGGGGGSGAYGPAIYVKSGANTYGTKPTMDLGNAMKLATGNAWGLAQGEESDPHVFAVEAPETLTLGGPSCYPVTETWGLDSPPHPVVGSIQSDHFYVSASQVQWVGHRNDPDDNGYPLTIVMASPLTFPRTLTMGDSFVTPLTTGTDASTGLPVKINGQTLQIRTTVSFVGTRTSHNTILGRDFTDCSVVERYIEVPVMGYAELYIYVYDANVGVVEYHTVQAGGNNSDWLLKWARVVGAQPLGEVDLVDFNIATYFPLATGNQWRLGPTSPSSTYATGLVGSPGSGGGYTNWYPVTMIEDSQTWSTVDRCVTDSSARRYVGGDYYTSTGAGPYPMWFTPAFTVPRPWQIGLVSRGSMTGTVVGAPGNPTFQIQAVQLPVAFGLTVVRPFRTFYNCVAVAGLMQYKQVGTTQWGWEHKYTVYAPEVGPVAYWLRRTLPGETQEDTYSKYGLLQWADVGGVYIGP